jgi:hypothetical protein
MKTKAGSVQIVAISDQYDVGGIIGGLHTENGRGHSVDDDVGRSVAP